MPKFSNKIKIVLLGVAWLLISLVLFGWVYSGIETENKTQALLVLDKKKEYGELVEEQKSYIQGKNDLENLAKQAVQPQDFFSRDTSLVREIESLERLASTTQMEIVLGIAGNTKMAQKAKTRSEIVVVPYTMQVTGTYEGAFGFIKGLEDMPFVTDVREMQITSTGKGNISLSISAVFYVKK